MPYIVYKAHTNTFDRKLPDWEAVMELIARKAQKFNYGIYRHWEEDGAHYFDCGPTVYKVVQEI
jgi:hypothetical protein